MKFRISVYFSMLMVSYISNDVNVTACMIIPLEFVILFALLKAVSKEFEEIKQIIIKN